VTKPQPAENAKVYCPMCTHMVDAEIQRRIVNSARHAMVKPGQKCPHCSASLDAGYIMPRVSSGRAA